MYKKKFISFLIISGFILLNLNNTEAKTNKIFFKINNEIITTVDLIQETRYLLNINKELKNTNKEIIYELAKKTLIRNKIKEIEILNSFSKIDLQKKTIIDLLLKQFKINSENELNNFLEEKKINKEFLINKFKNEILWNDLIVAKYLKKIKIDINQIKKDLKTQKIEKEYLLSEILFNLDNDENLKQKKSSINKMIQDKSFSEAALTFGISASSEKGGKIGWIKENSLSKNIRNELNKIDKDKITEPIVIPGGFLILKINDVRVVDVKINVEDEIKKITQERTQKQLAQYSVIYFNKVKKNFSINEF